jgi:NHL repeat
MARPTTESERVTAFREPSQQLPPQVSDSICDAEKEFQVPTLIASIRPNPTPLLSSTLRRLLAAACLLAFPAALSAQTAEFSWVQSTVGTGLSIDHGVAVDGSGNVYIADSGNHRVLKETLSGGAYTQSTVADSSSAYQLQYPYGVAVDGSGNVYIADFEAIRVLKETLSAGAYTQSVVADSTGPFDLQRPEGVAVDANGNVNIADADTGLVLKGTPSGASYTQSTVGNGFGSVSAVAVDGSGNVYIV